MATTMYKQFTPSVNIIRDEDKSLDYIITPNTQSAFTKIVNDYMLGIRAFTIIGAYGTGKSSFLWAFNRAVNWQGDYFDAVDRFEELSGYKSINLVGEYSSLITKFAETVNVFGEYSVTDIIDALDEYYQQLKLENKGLLILIDEFGKFLEFAAKKNPDQELYFVQQLAEYVNDLDKEIFFITTLHQDFSSYAFGLTKSQQNEWTKVKGRLKEIPFNEPVEQLLYLASERLEHLENKPKFDKKHNALFEVIKTSKSFPLRDYFNEKIAEKLAPFDILAAAVLALSLQTYGQNERSLFTFIESDDYLGIREFKYQSPYYNLSSVYDYLIQNYTILFTKNNPHYPQWAAIRYALERAEGVLDKHAEDANKILKTIGLLNIFASKAARLDESFYRGYGKLSLGIDDTDAILKSLQQHKIIRYVKHKHNFILFEGTDLDIEREVEEAANRVEQTLDIVKSLKDYFEFPYILAKSAYFETGTPRFFEFVLSEDLIANNKIPAGKVDGFINLIFSDKIKLDTVIRKSASTEAKSPILYGIFKNSKDIKSILFEIRKIQKVIELNEGDAIALRELESLKSNQIDLLNQAVFNGIYGGNKNIKWVANGVELKILNQKEFNKTLSTICMEVYSKTPIYNNEMVNKTRLSTPIRTALKSLIRALVNNWQEEDLGFESTKFPPEKTIYLSLIKETGIIQKIDGAFVFTNPTNASFQPLWEATESFMTSTKSAKRSVLELKELLLKAPFKLKEGFLEFWVPIFLFAKRDDYALFEGDVYIPTITDQVLEVAIKNPQKYFVKAFNIDGVRLELFHRYRKFLGQREGYQIGNDTFIETIRPFLSFYRGLPDYAKHTKRLSKEALSLRDCIANAKNPEQVFFEDFPAALGFTPNMLEEDEHLNNFIELLKSAIMEIRKSYDEVLNRFEEHIKSYLGLSKMNFDDWRMKLQTRFEGTRMHLLQQAQKVFLQRVNSDLDRISWLNSVSQACIGKTLEKLKDEDELLLHDKFVECVEQMDNLVELCMVQDETVEDQFVAVELTSLEKGTNKKIVRLPNEKVSKVNTQIEKLKKLLSKEKDVNLASLAQLLNELMNDD